MISLYFTIPIVAYGKTRECIGAYFWVGRGWYASWAARNTVSDVIIVNSAAVTLQQSIVDSSITATSRVVGGWWRRLGMFGP